ncbi:MAG: PilZ domain-containing protein [Treponema sp.]|nr:PilZ domain-containing protein [Treponema sp.]
MINFFLFLPLQVSATDFNFDANTTNPTTVLIGFIVIAVIIAVLIIVNSKKPGISGSSSGGGGGGAGRSIFAGLALHRIARNIGLNNEQANMLSYVFKIDQVIEPEKSINNPALLDRHFRRAYRLIENGAGTAAEIQRKLAILFSTRNALENSLIGGITSSKSIKDDTQLVLNTGKERINSNVISAKGENLVLEAPKSVLGSQIKIQRGTRLTVLFFTKNNKGFSFESRVTGYSSQNSNPTMLIAHSNNLRFLSQRRFRRRQAVIACSLYLVYVEGSGKKQRLVVDKRRLQGNIGDISVGGCSMKILAPVQVGARFKIEFTQSDVNVAALGQVLRSNKTGMNTIIHVKFLKIPQRSMNIINSFVYEYGRE